MVAIIMLLAVLVALKHGSMFFAVCAGLAMVWALLGRTWRIR